MNRTAYFTSDNIESVCRNVLNEIARARSRRNRKFIIEKSALLIIDMQKYFLNKSSHAYVPSADAIIPNIKKLAQLFIAAERPVIATRHQNTADDAQMMSKWWDDVIEKDSETSEIQDYIVPNMAIILEKCQYDAFYKTNLKEILIERNVEQIVITGVVTHLCCETTARSAFVNGFEVFLPADATADFYFDHYKATLLNVADGFGSVVMTNSLC